MDAAYLISTSKDNKYLQTKDDSVYKITPEHFLKISPWENGEDRRVFEIDDDDYHIITYDKACMIVNKQFANKVEKWEHNGKKYIANSLGDKDPIEHTYLLSTLPNHKIINKTEKLLNELPGKTITIGDEDGKSELKLIKHKGKVYYILIINEFLPRVQMYDTFGKFCQWCNIKNCKPIFCLNDNKYI